MYLSFVSLSFTFKMYVHIVLLFFIYFFNICSKKHDCTATLISKLLLISDKDISEILLSDAHQT